MGKALLEGWSSSGILATSVTVQDPSPSDWLIAQPGLRLNEALPEAPAALVVATKPQILDQVLPGLSGFGGRETTIISIAAGAPVALFEDNFGPETAVIRAMPNLPASIGHGVTAIFGNASCGSKELTMAEALFKAVGTTVTLPEEDMLHLVTGLSGSGPAYVFAMAEAMAAAAQDLGMPQELAKKLAFQTVSGAGRMLSKPDADATALRVAVTSKGGTTAAGLSQLMRSPNSIETLMHTTIDAARLRSEELAITSVKD